jgi:hypothetical protein
LLYGKYGFLSADDNFNKADKMLSKKYKENKKIIENVLTKDITKLEKYIKKSFEKIKNKGDLKLENIIKLKDIMNDYKLCDFLKILLIEYDRTNIR